MAVAKSNETKQFINPNSYCFKYENGECPICCSEGLLIPCKICEKIACKKCIHHFILANENENTKCMFCSTILNKNTLVDMLGVTFVNTLYKEHQNKIILNKQMVLLQTFQPIAEAEIKCEKIEKEISDLQLIITQKKK
jgi:hypothetical protein